MEITKIYKYFSKETDYKPFDIETETNSILFINILSFKVVLNIIDILINTLNLRIEKIAYYNNKLIIGVKLWV